jgi:hypothetical protein
VTEPLDYDQVVAIADGELNAAQAQADADNARAVSVRLAAECSQARLAEASFIRAFIERHPGRSVDDLLLAAETELRGAEGCVRRAQAEVLAAEAAVTEAAERVRDLQGYIRIVRQQAGREDCP